MFILQYPSPNQLPNCLKIPETRDVLIAVIGVIFDVSAYTVTVSLFALRQLGTINALLGP